MQTKISICRQNTQSAHPLTVQALPNFQSSEQRPTTVKTCAWGVFVSLTVLKSNIWQSK